MLFGATLQYHLRAGVRAVCLSGALLTLYACVGAQPNPEPVTQPPTTPSPLPVTPVESPRQQARVDEVLETPPELLPGSGRMAWAEGFQGELVQGLDGELYPVYHAAAISRVQQVLRERGLYSGPVNGVLDTPTMESIYAFQEANYYLQRCGVPTPRTRKLLEQGSHTDA